LEYKYRYVLGLPVKGGAALSFGSTIHKTFEKFLRNLKQGQQSQDLFGQNENFALPAFELLEKYYNESWIGDWYDGKNHMEEYRKLGKGILKIFYEELKKNLPKPKYLETAFRMRLKAGYFLGKIDRGDQTSAGLLIIDYKTGAPRGINKVDRQQLLIYQWAAQEFFKEKVADLQYWFLRDKLTKESFLGQDKDVSSLKEDITRTIADIIEATKQNSFSELDKRISHECGYRILE
jgi:RecB family exonuclease